jgi:DNA-binding CsgD family transcriptional regulator
MPCGQLIETRVLASELGMLFERLDIDAVLTDRTGIPLAATTRMNGDGVAPVAGGRRVVEFRLFGQPLCIAVTAPEVSTSVGELTSRQQEVMGLIRDGLQNREIAERLDLSLHTVRRHVEAALKRLDVPTRAAAAVLLSQIEHA